MIEEQARVTGADDHIAEICIEKQSACGSCSAKSGCGTSLLSTWLPKRRLVFRLNNAIGAKAGDQVILGLDERVLQRGSLLLYALPLAGLLLGAIAGERAFAFLSLPAELGAVLIGLSGLTAALAYVRYLSARKLHGNDGGVRLLRVVNGAHAFAPIEFASPKVNQTESFGMDK